MRKYNGIYFEHTPTAPKQHIPWVSQPDEPVREEASHAPKGIIQKATNDRCPCSVMDKSEAESQGRDTARRPARDHLWATPRYLPCFNNPNVPTSERA